MKREPGEWTPSDIQAVLTQSPWARRVNPELSVTWLRSKEKGGARGPAGSDGLRDTRSLTEFSVLVRWESALPVRLARNGPSASKSNPPDYVLSLTRIPAEFIEAGLGAAQNHDEISSQEWIAAEMKRTSMLQLEGKAPIAAVRAAWTRSDFEPSLMLTFPRSGRPIDVQDTAVTLESEAGPLALKVSFPLGRMVYRGKLEL